MTTAQLQQDEGTADGMLIRRHKVKPAGRERECLVYEPPNAVWLA